ncbi:GPI ethanolamine phosphate transferase 3 isoform X2 [Malania oleifera]|uniref:GPI ethanolamine phosphate transferase 3 isoform X2 n=1 Tax=Malania oleifera TaxID=397392 RepID=UPI0025ADA862|nr:GPI ethanolamine phosphate transferase 3 isoform X2 [Malania oleifera]
MGGARGGRNREGRGSEKWGRRRNGKWGQMWLFLFVITVVHGVAILIFTRGFLLTRTELPFSSHCSDVSQSPCFSSSSIPSSNSSANHHETTSSSHHKRPRCWTKPAIDRLVIIVLDALRFDFVAPSKIFQESKAWMDKLLVLQQLASTQRSSARIFKAIADPPTTSLQRLKGLTTGGLPTFIDVGNSFGAPAIVEDNFIQQLVQNGKRVVMMGDDTWTQLYPHHFNKSYPYPSFNVKDLHTVDNGCIEHLTPTLYEEDWDVLIAHFLGVDHAGHIFGVDSSPMVQKLEQYNVVLEKVIEVLESQSGPLGLHENTFLVVMGDHGQTLNGDHGGGSPEEVETSIFAMNFKKLQSSIPFKFDSSCEHDLDGKMCINSIQQVKRYVDVYSASSLIGFSAEDMSHIADLYAQADENWSHITMNLSLYKNEGHHFLLPALKRQIDLYSNFLAHVADLARSKWTEFNIKMMATGFGIMLISLLLHFLVIKRMNQQYGVSLMFCGQSGISFNLIFSCFVVAIRAISFLSNSYILLEGRVANFLLATTGIVKLRYSIMKEKMLLEAVLFLLLVTVCRFMIDVGLSKQGATSVFLKVQPSWMLKLTSGFPLWIYIDEVVPLLMLVLLVYLLSKAISCKSCEGVSKRVIMGTIINYMLIAVQWASESRIWRLDLVFDAFGRNLIPQIIYAIVVVELSFLVFGQLLNKDSDLDCKKSLVNKTVAMLSAWSSVVILLSGKQGPLIALASIIGGYCIMRLDNIEQDIKDGIGPLPVTQWNLLAVCLFFCSGHWCAFDGLRYGAAFIGFDEFILVRQGVLLAIDTFGFSHILPIFGLPLLAVWRYIWSDTARRKQFILIQLTQVYMMYGLIMATAVAVMMLCVTIHRRHLMVWGLFTPKFVFDVVGLLLADVLICLASLFCFRQVEDDDEPHHNVTEN